MSAQRMFIGPILQSTLIFFCYANTVSEQIWKQQKIKYSKEENILIQEK